MCGISGYIYFQKEKKAEKEIIKKMIDIISHRGPDGEGIYVNKNIGLGHRRLSIIDLNTGNQPMISTDENIVIVFNGEIYNYIELREQLKTLGYNFKTESDTEVVIAAYLIWGKNCLQKFNGMWSFAIYDKRNDDLFLSRDRIGEKPLYFYYDNDVFIFGSEIKSILKYGINIIYNDEVLELYLIFGYVPAPYTFYKNIYKLMPGENITIKNKNIIKNKYWELPEIDEEHMIKNKKKVYEEFENLLCDSIKIRMRSDVPYGAFLSGGLDSSSVVAIMSDLSSFPVETFTIGFDDKNFDESELANEVANKYNCNHHNKLVSYDSFDKSLDNIIFHYDEPFGDSSAIPTGFVSKYAREKVKMVLTGDGGDEVLSGYTSYQGEKFVSDTKNVPDLVIKTGKNLISVSKNLQKGLYRYKLNRIENILNSTLLDYNTRLINKSAWSKISIAKNIIKERKNTIRIEDYVSDFMNKCSYKNGFYKNMYFNLKLSLPDDMLTKVDRMSMAYSLEARVPLLDYRIIEFLVKVDKSIKMKGYQRKTILRETIGKKLPGKLLKAHKRGFGVPLREWFKEEIFNEKFNDLYKNNGCFNINVIKEVIKSNNSGEQDLGNFIWMLFVFNKWINNYN